MRDVIGLVAAGVFAPENAPTLFGAAAVAIVAIWAIRGFFRGALRLFIGMACLAGGAAVGYWVFLNGAGALEMVMRDPPPKASLWLAIGAGIIAYLALAALVGILFRPFSGDKDKRRGPVGLGGAILSLVPSIFLVWLIGTALRSGGAVADLDWTDTSVAAPEGSEPPDRGFLAQIRDHLADSWIGRALNAADPVAPEETATLTRLLLLLKDPQAWDRLAADPQTAPILASPIVERLVRDNDVAHEIAQSDFPQLLRRPEVRAAANSQSVGPHLRALNADKAIADALYSDPGSHLAPLIGPDGQPIPRAKPFRRPGSYRPDPAMGR